MRVKVQERLEAALSVAFATIAYTVRGGLSSSSTVHTTMPVIPMSSKSSRFRYL